MTDNFNHFRELVNIMGGLPKDNKNSNLDEFYTIQLIRRGKDNPDMPAANYKFKVYYIYSQADLDKFEGEIKEVCKLLRLRAYVTVTIKSMAQVALNTLYESARRIATHDYKKFYSIFEGCTDKYACRGKNLWVIDVDDVSEKDNDFVDRLIGYINSMNSQYNGDNVIYTMPTKSGIHLITRPFNLNEYRKGWHNVFGDIELCEAKKNHLTLLYEDL